MLLTLSACANSNKEAEVDNFPSKTIQLIVAYSPGAATDTQARIIAKYANKYLNQELVIVNKPGGGGQVGWNNFTTVKPDGYTLAVYNLPHIISQPLVNDTTFSVDTFEPVVNWGGDPTVFAVRADSDINSLEDLIKQAQASPNTVTVGNAGKYVGQHLAILQLEDAAKVKLEDVPYQGSADAIAALLGGHIDVVSGNLSDIYRLGEEVKPLAIASEERHPFDRDIPTFGELGYPEVVMSTDRGIAAPEGTPKEIISKLEEAFMELLNDEEFIKEMEKAGADLLIMDREQVLDEMEKRQETYEGLLKNIGVIE